MVGSNGDTRHMGDPEFDGKVVLVTGGASGIGLAVCELFAEKGCKVAMTDIGAEVGEKALANIQADAGRENDDFLFLKVDVTKETDVEEMVHATLERFGRIDVSVNCAGIEGEEGPFDETSTDNFHRVMQVNCFGVYYCMKHVIKAMKAQGKPESGTHSIVNIGSRTSVMAFPGMAGYCASKHAVFGLTRTAATEVAHLGIRVNALCPGTTMTPLLERYLAKSEQTEADVAKTIPLGRLGSSREMAEAVSFLSSSKCGFIVGHALTACGGESGY